MLFCVFLHLNFNQMVYDCVTEVDTYESCSLVYSVVLNIFVNCVQFSSTWFTLLVMICTLQIHACSWLQAAQNSKMLHERRCSAKDQGHEIHLVNLWLTTCHTRRSRKYQWLDDWKLWHSRADKNHRKTWKYCMAAEPNTCPMPSQHYSNSKGMGKATHKIPGPFNNFPTFFPLDIYRFWENQTKTRYIKK
jgi:hypothetical protein